jgi:hypothetical protein
VTTSRDSTSATAQLKELLSTPRIDNNQPSTNATAFNV